MSPPEDSPPPTPALLGEISAKLDQVLENGERIVGLSAQAVTQIERAIRLVAANQQLGARERMEFEQILSRFKREFASMARAPREPSRTIVTDLTPVPAPIEALTIESSTGARGDEISVVFFRLPFTKKVRGIPNDWLRKMGIALASSSVGAGIIHLLHQWGVLH